MEYKLQQIEMDYAAITEELNRLKKEMYKVKCELWEVKRQNEELIKKNDKLQNQNDLLKKGIQVRQKAFAEAMFLLKTSKIKISA